MYPVIYGNSDLHSALCFSPVCKAWFDRARKSLPTQNRSLDPVMPTSDSTHMLFRGTKRKTSEIDDAEVWHTQDVYKKMRIERRSFKNIRVFSTQLAKTPTTISNVRHSKMQGRRKCESFKVPKNTWTPAVRQPAETSKGQTESTKYAATEQH